MACLLVGLYKGRSWAAVVVDNRFWILFSRGLLHRSVQVPVESTMLEALSLSRCRSLATFFFRWTKNIAEFGTPALQPSQVHAIFSSPQQLAKVQIACLLRQRAAPRSDPSATGRLVNEGCRLLPAALYCSRALGCRAQHAISFLEIPCRRMFSEFVLSLFIFSA